MIVTTDNQFTFREAESGTYSSTFVSSFNGRDGVVVLTADDVTAALGYIPGTGSGTVTVDDVTGLQAALDSKQPVGDYATSSDLVTGLASKQPLGSYANAIHTHVIADVTGLQGALDGKAAVSHTHIIGDVTGLQSALDAKQPVGTYATGTGTATGTNTGDQTTITGNAGTATKLATARTINGVAFDGTGNITINAVDSTARVPDTRTISTTAPLSGGGTLAANRTLSISAATTLAAGSMSAEDKTKLDAISGTNTGDETYSSITTKLAAGSGGGTSNFLRADGAFAPPPSGGGGTTTNAVTFNNAGAGAVSGTTFDGSAARTISYNTVGAAAATHTHAYTDINNVGTGTVMYRKTAGTGAAETQTLATLKTDLGLSGTNTGDQTTISGNAGSATVLQTARTINGTSFNGSANITVTAVNPFSATFNNSGTGVVSGTSHNGSAAQTISYNTIGAAPTTRTISTTAPLTGGGDLSANRTLAISAATTSAAGSMSSADKTKLDTVVTGTYTPTVAGLSNVDLVAAWPLQYVRVGNVVTVSGRVEIDATSVGSVTRISMSLPITTAFSGANQAGGVASSSADSSPAQVLAIYANPSSALVWFDGRAQSASSLGHWFSFTYQII